MKKRNTVLISGVLSIFILISIQVFMIRNIWKQKDEMFALRYTMWSQEAISFINRRMPTDGFDTVRLLLRGYSGKAINELHAIKNREELTVKKKEILDYFTEVVNREQDLSELLSSYFERRGFDKNFNFSIEVQDLEIISHDTIIIYQNGFSDKQQTSKGKGMASSSDFSKSRVLVNRPILEDNDYRFLFNYYIDFSNKRRLILKETSASLGMSIFSILAVAILFMITYRNLREEKRLSDLKTDFINNMTHELKTPLSTITVAGRTLEMEQIRANQDKILETARMIGKQSIHLNQIINMILDISMWERTQFQLDKKPVEIERVLDEVVESFKSGDGCNATINRKYDFKGVIVDLDVVYFTTMINNLLSNAVKYSDRVPVISVEGFARDNQIFIRVIDNGIGINKIDQKHLFDKFYRASSGNIHKFKGLGLGLYYVKKITEAHGGSVAVDSKPGKGSIFTITIPY
ncbi:MAG: HAMP domain-containing histidine kinase [Bacteroidales bacterium]|nr:HAMP domain-containing histidine kinase [Bacteroidales bacterium]